MLILLTISRLPFYFLFDEDNFHSAKRFILKSSQQYYGLIQQL